MLSNYTNFELIGKGAYGKIFKALRKSDNTVVALKKVNLKNQCSQEQTDTLNEIRVMERVDHPNIVKFYEAFLEGGCVYIVMEYLGGGDLAALIRWYSAAKAPIPEEALWRYCAELASAFKYMHSMRIIHRDIKPSNILIDNRNRNALENDLKVADFGFGKSLGAQMMAYSSVGTPIYCSPEAVSGCGYNESSDIWGLGCVMYELATFRVPFSAKSQQELKRVILYEKPDPIPTVYSKDLENLIMSMLCKDPKIRPCAAQILAYPPLCRRFPEMNAAIFHDEEEEIVADIHSSIESGESGAAQTSRLIKMLAVERHRNKELQATLAEMSKKMRALETSLSEQTYAMDALTKENAQLMLCLSSVGATKDNSDEMLVSPVKQPQERNPVTPQKGTAFPYTTTPMKATEEEGDDVDIEGEDINNTDCDAEKEHPIPKEKKATMNDGGRGKSSTSCGVSSGGGTNRSKGRSNSVNVKALTFSPETPVKPKSKRTCTYETPFKYSLIPFRADYFGFSPPLAPDASVGALYAWKRQFDLRSPCLPKQEISPVWANREQHSFIQRSPHVIVLFRCMSTPQCTIKSLYVRRANESEFVRLQIFSDGFRFFKSASFVWAAFEYKDENDLAQFILEFESPNVIEELVVIRGSKLTQLFDTTQN